MPKRSIRANFLAQRKARTQANCLTGSQKVQALFLRSDLFQEAGSLALYSAIHNEVQTETVAGIALESGKILAYPRMRNDHLEFLRVFTRTDLTPGRFGVLEPQHGELIPVEELDVVVVPGVVFDRVGHRLGYGRGFYDRALSVCRAECLKVGFAYDSQVVESLPVARHDRRLSALVTESQIVNFDA